MPRRTAPGSPPATRRDRLGSCPLGAVRAVSRERERAGAEVLIANHRASRVTAGEAVREHDLLVERQRASRSFQDQRDPFRVPRRAKAVGASGCPQHACNAVRARRPDAADVAARRGEPAGDFRAARATADRARADGCGRRGGGRRRRPCRSRGGEPSQSSKRRAGAGATTDCRDMTSRSAKPNQACSTCAHASSDHEPVGVCTAMTAAGAA